MLRNDLGDTRDIRTHNFEIKGDGQMNRLFKEHEERKPLLSGHLVHTGVDDLERGQAQLLTVIPSSVKPRLDRRQSRGSSRQSLRVQAQHC